VDGQRFELVVWLRREHYPFWTQSQLNGVERMEVLPGSLNVFAQAGEEYGDKLATLVKYTALGGLMMVSVPAMPYDADLKFYLDNKVLSDVWIAVTWKA
jgi:hypothetical protein